MKILSTTETLPVSLERAKKHLRVTSNSDDSLIEELIKSACYKAEQATWRSIVSREYMIEVINELGRIDIPLPPTESIDKVEYYSDGEWEELTAETDFYEFGLDEKYIEISSVYERVRVSFTSGALNNPDVNRLIMDLVAVYYDHRPDEELLEANVVMKLSKYKAWVAG